MEKMILNFTSHTCLQSKNI